MLYHEPNIMAQRNLTNRQTSLSRTITYCPTPETYFVKSYCDPENWIAGTLQRYTIVCQSSPEILWNGNGSPVTKAPQTIRRSAYCMPDEVCITTNRHTTEANCVKSVYFTLTMNNWAGVQTANGLLTSIEAGDPRDNPIYNFGNMSASMVLSDKNGTAPIEVDTFKTDAGLAEGEAPVQSQKCRDCIDLETKPFEPDTSFLKTEVRLLTTGAAAGILWLAIMSG